MFHYRINNDGFSLEHGQKSVRELPRDRVRSKNVSHELGPMCISARTEDYCHCQVMYLSPIVFVLGTLGRLVKSRR